MEAFGKVAEAPLSSASAPHAKAKASKGFLGAGAAASLARCTAVGTASTAVVDDDSKEAEVLRRASAEAAACGKSGGSGLAPPTYAEATAK